MAKEGGGVVGGIIHPYSSSCFFTPVENSYLCFGENTNYKLFLAIWTEISLSFSLNLKGLSPYLPTKRNYWEKSNTPLIERILRDCLMTKKAEFISFEQSRFSIKVR